MTPIEKQLLLQDICARLPYDVIVQETFQNAQRDVPVWDCGPHYIKGHLEKVKPYLRPLESMTDDEKEEVNKLFEHESSFLTPYPSWYVFEDNIQKVVDFYLSHHLDWRGLIEMGLALEAPEGMYKTN